MEVMKVLMSIWVGQLFWQGASAHLRQRPASFSAARSLSVVCLMSSKLCSLPAQLYNQPATGMATQTTSTQHQQQQKHQQYPATTSKTISATPATTKTSTIPATTSKTISPTTHTLATSGQGKPRPPTHYLAIYAHTDIWPPISDLSSTH